MGRTKGPSGKFALRFIGLNLGKVFGDMRSRIEITSGSDAKDDQLNKNILTLSQILENSPALSANDKIAAAEHLDQILDERQKPENSRRKGIILSSIDYLTKLLGAIPDLAQGWTLTEQAIRDTFGV